MSAGTGPGRPPTSHRHHFISKRQVRRWAFDRVDEPDQARVWTRWKKTGEVKPLPVRAVMVEIDHHLIRMEDGTDSSWIDSDLVAKVEGIAVVIEALIHGTHITSSIASTDRRALAIFINLLRGSVPSRIAEVVARIDRDLDLRARFDDWLSHHPGKPDPLEARRQFALGGALGEVLDGGQTTELAERTWELFRIEPSGPATLILADAPVLEYALPGDDMAAHLLLAFPVNPWTLLVLHPVTGPDRDETWLAAGDVAMLNHRSWEQTTRVAVANDASMLEDGAILGSTMTPPVMRQASIDRHPEVFG